MITAKTITDHILVVSGESPSTEGYLRVASMAIAFYDYLVTLPIEYRVYRSQAGFLHMRYISVLVIITSNYGYFATTFTVESCRRFYFVPPMFKVMQSAVSHAILGVRTFNIAGRNKTIGILLLGYSIITITLEWFFDFYHRVGQPSSVYQQGNCISGVVNHPTTWVFYLVAMIYDLVSLVVSTIYLYQFRSYSGKFSQLIRVMIYDGLIFFVSLTGKACDVLVEYVLSELPPLLAVNVLNLFLYQQQDFVAQSTGTSLAYAIVWIMSQRILIHLRELATDRKGSSPLAAVVVHPGHSSLGGGTSHHRTQPSPLCQHSSGFPSPLDRKGALHDISETDVDVEFGRPPSPIALQHHPFSSSTAIVNIVGAETHFHGTVPAINDTA
ncbi:hypothetical protein V8B97DRAFT_1914491 [Scleroderma yunnanense]